MFVASSVVAWNGLIVSNDAKHFRTGVYLRRMFVSAMAYESLTNTCPIWDRFKDALIDDLPYRLRVDEIHCHPSIENTAHDYGSF